MLSSGSRNRRRSRNSTSAAASGMRTRAAAARRCSRRAWAWTASSRPAWARFSSTSTSCSRVMPRCSASRGGRIGGIQQVSGRASRPLRARWRSAGPARAPVAASVCCRSTSISRRTGVAASSPAQGGALHGKDLVMHPLHDDQVFLQRRHAGQAARGDQQHAGQHQQQQPSRDHDRKGDGAQQRGGARRGGQIDSGIVEKVAGPVTRKTMARYRMGMPRNSPQVLGRARKRP